MERCLRPMLVPHQRNTGPFFIETKYLSLPVYQGRCKVQRFPADVTWLPSSANLSTECGCPFLAYEFLFPWSHDIFQWDQGAAVKWEINDILVLDDSVGAISSLAGQSLWLTTAISWEAFPLLKENLSRTECCFIVRLPGSESKTPKELCQPV